MHSVASSKPKLTLLDPPLTSFEMYRNGNKAIWCTPGYAGYAIGCTPLPACTPSHLVRQLSPFFQGWLPKRKPQNSQQNSQRISKCSEQNHRMHSISYHIKNCTEAANDLSKAFMTLRTSSSKLFLKSDAELGPWTH